MKEITRKKLISEGWFEGRKIDITYTLDDMEFDGYTVTESFIKFYEEFVDLILVCEIENHIRGVSFMKETAEDYYSLNLQKKYIRITGSEVLNPIGAINTELVLAIDEKGIVYLLDSGHVTIIGKNRDEILDNLITRSWSDWKDSEKFPYPKWWMDDTLKIMKDSGIFDL